MRARPWLSALSLVLVAAPLSALPGAPFDQYEAFNRSDTLIQDRYTLLYWQRVPATGMTLAQAAAYCDGLTLDYGDFRLPSVKELLTLADDEGQKELENGKIVSKYIDRMAFPGPLPQAFWTSSVDSTGAPYVVDFTTGEAKISADFPQAVRCVRR